MAAPIRPIVLGGPSGSGKSTLVSKLLKEFPDYIALRVSHTTRKPREGEEHGKDYYFVTEEEFEQLRANDKLLEHIQFCGNFYGTSKKSVQDIQASGRICILIMEISGVKNIKAVNMDPRPLFIYVKVPSADSIRSRLERRGTETEEDIQKRLATFEKELDYASQPGAYDHILVNDDLDAAYENLKQLLEADIENLQQTKLGTGK